MNSTLAPPQPSFTCLKQFRDLTQHRGLRGGPGGGLERTLQASARDPPAPAHVWQVRRRKPWGEAGAGRRCAGPAP